MSTMLSKYKKWDILSTNFLLYIRVKLFTFEFMEKEVLLREMKNETKQGNPMSKYSISLFWF